jgi:2-oxoglutarate ferredoxin oxidoreductase subunit gamma
LLYEQDLVKLNAQASPDLRTYGIPATRLAEELGRKLVLNLVMVGFVTAMTSLVTPEAVRKSVQDSVPKGTEKLNLAAFEKGFEYGRAQLAAASAA